MAVELAVLEQKVEGLREEVTARFVEVRDDIRGITKTLEALVRIDGDLRNYRESLGRIGAEVKEHDKRLHGLEIAQARAAPVVDSHDRAQWLVRTVFLTTVGSIVTGVVVWLLTR